MRFPALGETDLLVPLHDGLFEQPLWRTFLARLRSATGMAGVALAISGTDRATFVDGTVDEQEIADLLSANPHLRAGRVYAQSELDTSAGSLQSDIRLIQVREDNGLSAQLILIDAQPISAATASLLASLAPHMQVVLRNFAAIERERARADLSEGVIARMNFGWISLDRQCRIVDCNSPAERVLRLSGLLRRGPYNRLVPASPVVDRELAGLVSQCAADSGLRPHAVTLSHDPWIDMLVSPVRLVGMGAGGSAVALIYLRGDRSTQADRHEQLCDLFQLTASEARLAWSMAQGMSIAEAAQEHGLTVETARYYSKKIYAKTGARGQADLVRHILTSVLALA